MNQMPYFVIFCSPHLYSPLVTIYGKYLLTKIMKLNLVMCSNVHEIITNIWYYEVFVID